MTNKLKRSQLTRSQYRRRGSFFEGKAPAKNETSKGALEPSIMSAECAGDPLNESVESKEVSLDNETRGSLAIAFEEDATDDVKKEEKNKEKE